MRRGAALAAGLALSLTGCGGDSLSTAELRSQASRVCAAAGKRTARIALPASPSAGGAYLAKGVAVLAPELAALRALKPPGGLASVYVAGVGAFARKLDALEAAARELAGGGDPVIAMKALQERLSPLESEEDGAWRALEIPACLNR